MVVATSASDIQDQGFPVVYRHKKRPEWGAAIKAWERDGRVAYQFEDGKLRVFSDAHDHLFEEVDRPAEISEGLVDRLREELGISLARRRAVRNARRDGRSVWKLSDQIKVFEAEYPGGFSGEKWATEIRGGDSGRALKRYRDPALRKARELLSRENLEDQVGRGRYKDVVNAAADVIRSTSLARPADASRLESLPARRHEPFARSLAALLYGDEPFEKRMDAFVGVFEADGASCSWELATAFPALVAPEEHVVVQAVSFRRQAEWMAPRLKVERNPSGETYARLRRMALAVAGRLRGQEYNPRDLIDIHDFIRLTTRPAARKILGES